MRRLPSITDRATGPDIAHFSATCYVLQVAFEQAVGLLKKLLEVSDREIAQSVVDFPEHVRFGVPTPAARILAADGVRHRRAAVALGKSPELISRSGDDRVGIIATARQLLEDRERWLPAMGRLVLENTIADLRASRPSDHEE